MDKAFASARPGARKTGAPPVVFRCNVSAEVGIGHLMRCREMARLLTARGHACAILGPPDSLRRPGDAALFARWEEVAERGPSVADAARVLAMARAMGARHLVMDDYRIDPEYQLILRGAGMRWLQQFDASRPWDFWADVLVNSGPYERREHYRDYLKNPDTVTLLGPEYAVLRPEFTALTPRAPGRPVRRVLAAFGGGDDRGVLAAVLDALAADPLPGLRLVLASGRANPNAAAVAARVAALPDGVAEFHLDPPDMAGLMAGCDLALIAGGTMSYEAAICGLPMILVPLAPNQLRSCRGWADRTGARVLSGAGAVTGAEIRAAVTALMADDPARAAMARAGRALVDGKGTARLTDALLERETT